MCECIRKNEAAIKDKLIPSGVIFEEPPSFDDVCLPIVDGEMTVATYSEISWSEAIFRKNGNKAIKKKTSRIVHNYCPFCGEKYQMNKEDQGNA